MNIILLGPPGAGKGTMAERVKERFNLAHISTGDILRGEIKAGSELGSLAKGYIDKGALVPDDVIISMMKKRFAEDDAKAGVLLDGFPRTVAQAEALSGIADVDACITLDASEDMIVDRISSRRICRDCGGVYSVKSLSGEECEKCGGKLYIRPDDKEETVRQRFSVYQSQTEPLIDYYEKKGKLHHVDAALPIDEEAAEIIKIIESL
jgi:adenylate kinase